MNLVSYTVDDEMSERQYLEAMFEQMTVGKEDERKAARPHPDACGGDAHAVASGRSRRHDLRLPQCVSRQRHQAFRAGRLQALE